MTKEELAARLNGRGYGSEITKADATVAKEAGLVVVYGASDDLIEFAGAIHDEAGAPGEISITRDGLMESKCDEGDDCPYFQKLQKKATVIEALWCEPNLPTWIYKTSIPHATFDIQSDDESEGIYCRGIVFALADVPAL